MKTSADCILYNLETEAVKLLHELRKVHEKTESFIEELEALIRQIAENKK